MKIFSPGRRQIGIRRVQIPRCLGPPGVRAAAVIAAAAGSGRQSHGTSLAVQRSASELQLLPIHLLLLVT